MILDLAEAGTRPPHDCDVLLIGAGTCGLLLADSLRGGGWRVVVLESGGLVASERGQALNEVEQGGSRHYRGATEGRARVLGGTSSLWGGALLPFQPHDLEPRPHLRLPGWPIAHSDVAEWIPSLERVFALPPGDYGADWLDASVRRHDGIKDDDAFETRFAKWPAFVRRNTSRLFEERVRNDAELVVCLHATADSLQPAASDDSRVSGAVCIGPDGRRHTVRARRTIVCTGAIESTRLLLASAKAELAPRLQSLTWLGRGFHDHLSMHVAELHPPDPLALNRLAGFRFHGSAMRSHRLELTAQAQHNGALPSGWAHIGFEGTSPGGFEALRRIMQSLQRRHRPALSDAGALLSDAPYVARVVAWRLFRRQLLWPRQARYLVTVVGEQLPRAENTIQLSKRRNALGQQLPRIEWSIDHQDLETLRQTALRLGQYWQRHASATLGPMHWLLPLDKPFDARQLDLSDIYHPGGTTRMSRSENEGVVDTNLAVHGIDGLHVLSTSVFPTGASANPTMTLLLLALRLANHLGQALAQSD